MLSISEKIFVLSLYEKRNGSIQLSKSPFLPYGLAAGGLLEIVFSKVGMINSSKKIVVINPISEIKIIPGDLIKQILFEKEYKKSSFWIEVLGRKRKRIEEDFVTSFLQKNILIMDGQICHFHPDSIGKPTIKFTVKEELRSLILGGAEFDLQNYAVLKILETIHMLDQIFTYDEIKPIHQQVDQILPAQEMDSVDTADLENLKIVMDALNQIVNLQKS